MEPQNDIVDRLRLAPDADFYKPSKWFELMRDAADKITEAAAFLDALANRLDDGLPTSHAQALEQFVRAAADCRAMAAKLRK